MYVCWLHQYISSKICVSALFLSPVVSQKQVLNVNRETLDLKPGLGKMTGHVKNLQGIPFISSLIVAVNGAVGFLQAFLNSDLLDDLFSTAFFEKPLVYWPEQLMTVILIIIGGWSLWQCLCLHVISLKVESLRQTYFLDVMITVCCSLVGQGLTEKFRMIGQDGTPRVESARKWAHFH